MVTLFGIKNCDTVKKARNWMDSNGIDYRFHDFRSDGLNVKQVSQWVQKIGLDEVLNKRSATWKQISDTDKNYLLEGNDLTVIADNPTLIKRPVLEMSTELLVGFNIDRYKNLFGL